MEVSYLYILSTVYVIIVYYYLIYFFEKEKDKTTEKFESFEKKLKDLKKELNTSNEWLKFKFELEDKRFDDTGNQIFDANRNPK